MKRRPAAPFLWPKLFSTPPSTQVRTCFASGTTVSISPGRMPVHGNSLVGGGGLRHRVAEMISRPAAAMVRATQHKTLLVSCENDLGQQALDRCDVDFLSTHSDCLKICTKESAVGKPIASSAPRFHRPARGCCRAGRTQARHPCPRKAHNRSPGAISSQLSLLSCTRLRPASISKLVSRVRDQSLPLA